MTKILLQLCGVLAVSFQALAGPVVVGNGAGSEENQYVSIWTNRAEVFQICLNPSVECDMNPQEKVILQKLAGAAKAWAPFQFFSESDFATRASGLVQPAKVPFLAYSKNPGTVLFNFSMMYQEAFKFSYEKKLLVLAAVAADQAGVPSTQAGPVITKLVSFWQQRWSKLDLRVLSEPNLQIWVQHGTSLALLLFDDEGVFDLAGPLRKSLQCPAGTLQTMTLTSPYWSSFNKSAHGIQATFAANLTLKCSQGEPILLNVEMDLRFKSTSAKWNFVKESLKVHVSSLN